MEVFAHMSHDLSPALRALPNVPLLALHGDADPAAPLSAIQALSQQLPAMTLQTLPGRHHIFLTQHPACLAAMTDFLAALSSGPSGA